MRKFTIILILALASTQLFGVAAKVVTTTQLTFHNFSAGVFDITGCIITINNAQNPVNSLTIVAGVLNTPAGSYVTLGGLNIPGTSGSVALWAPGTDFNNISPADIISFVQWGAGAQPYEQIAVSAGLWAAATFVNSALPIARDGNYGSWGAGNWSSGLSTYEYDLEKYVDIGPMPFNDHINLEFSQGHDFVEANIYSVLGKLVEHMNVMQSTASLNVTTSNLVEGIYLIELKTSSGDLLVQRLIKH